VSKGHANPFSSFWTSKIRIGVSCLSDVSIRRMAQRTLNLPSGSLKLNLVKSMKWCLKVSKDNSNWFSASCAWKKRIERCCLRGVLIEQMVWRKHYVFLNVSNYYFSDIDEARFHDVEFWVLKKDDLDEIAKELF
jgi:hypothetical protein